MNEEKKDNIDVNSETLTNNLEEKIDNSTDEKSMGLILGSIVVVIIFVIAAFYLLGDERQDVLFENQLELEEIETIENGLQAQIDTVLSDTERETAETEGMSTSDELNSIEEDLDLSDFSDLDKELAEIEAGLELQ